MGITKQAKNITIHAKTSYTVRAKELVEIADKVNYEAHKDNLVLNSNASIDLKGEENGVIYSDYSPPELKVEESEFILESKFALEQLFAFAKKDSKAMFCFWMADIFGADIPLKAYEKLYEDASEKKESLNPKITVALSLPGYGAAYYSGENEKIKNHIIISEGFILNAIKDNKYQKLLMIALVEEFGHHLDYLLRNKYSTKKGDAKNDEGALFSGKMNRKYKKYYIDPFKVKEQHYATATIKGEEKKLTWDFADLNEKLNEFVDNRVEKDDNYFADYEFFGAGLGDDLHGLGHQSIENEGLGRIARYKNNTKGENIERSQIYFGNWLRDFSQFVDPMVVRPMANSLDRLSKEYEDKHVNKDENKKLLDELSDLMDKNYVTKADERTFNLPVGFILKTLEAEIEWKPTKLSPVKLSREAITSLVELIGLKEFGDLKEQKAKEDKDKKPQNYIKYIQDFRSKYAKVSTEVLGVYRPQEHIDNPAALHRKLICEENKKKGKACPPENLNNQLDDDFVKDPVEEQWDNNRVTGTKNYIRGFKCEKDEKGNPVRGFESAYDCFINYINKSDPNTVEGRINFGAALHILEDYFAHSNFCEIAIMKVYDPEVFPWDNMPVTCKKGELKNHKADISNNTHAINSVIDRNKIKFKTINNSDLWTNSVKSFMSDKDPKKVHPAQYYANLGHVNYLENKGLYYAHAECPIVQTGSFGLLDTIASIAPKIINKQFSIHVEKQDELKEGERTFNDALIYEFLKDVSNAQASDSKENQPSYKGTDDNVYSKAFLDYLSFRDFMVKERWFGTSYQNVMSGFGILDYITGYVNVVKNVFYHFLFLSAANLIDDYQTYLDNELTLLESGNWKVNQYGPTHTQLAKDNGIQPLHHLAVELAEDAVYEVGRLFGRDDYKRLIINYADKILFQHPMHTDWMDEKVINWCKTNPNKVKLAHESSIVLYGIRHGYQEIANLYNQISVISDFNTTDKQKEEFKAAINKIPAKWNAGWERLNKLWEEKGLEKIKTKTGKQSYEEVMKEAGHDHK